MGSRFNSECAANVRKLLQVGQKFELDESTTPSACLDDKMYIDKLERELQNCSQEIEYLQDQVHLRSVEANFMGEHVHSLELKLTEVDKLHERLRVMGDKLMQSDSKRLHLMSQLKSREEELQKSAIQIQELERMAFDCQCEIESLKFDLSATNPRCSEAERIGQNAAWEKDRMYKHLRESDLRIQEAQQLVCHLAGENKQLKKLLSERDGKRSSSTVKEHYNEMTAYMSSKINRDFLLQPSKELPSQNEACEFEESLGPFLSTFAVTACDQHAKDEIEKMANKIQESELLVKQLKEELREEKLKAKEDAEDLTQEMAELRYQITGMLEEEYKRRSRIEQASIQRIQELEAQVVEEQKKSIEALKRLQEARSLAERNSMEIKRLKKALKKFHPVTDPGKASTIESCTCGFCSISLEPVESSFESPGDCNQALLEWRPDKAHQKI